MAEETKQQETRPRGRMAALGLFKEKYPDKFAEGLPEPTDEELYEDLLTERNASREEKARFARIISENPQFSELIEKIGDDSEFMTSVVERNKRFKESMVNIENSVGALNRWIQKNSIPEEEADLITRSLVEIAANVDNGILTEDMFEFARKSINYDRSIEDTAREAGLAAKNAAIDAKKNTSTEQRREVIPDLTGRSAGTPANKSKIQLPQEKEFVDIFANAKKIE